MAQKFEPKLGKRRSRRRSRRQRSRQRHNQIKNQNKESCRDNTEVDTPKEVFSSDEDETLHPEVIRREKDGTAAADYEDMYVTKFGNAIDRLGKLFSYTFWRTQANSDVFWSVQGYDSEDPDCAAWITTHYFGEGEKAARFIQEIVLVHPTEKNIEMRYTSSIQPGNNCIVISRTLLQHFKHDNNSFTFRFKIIKLRRKPHKVLSNSESSFYYNKLLCDAIL